MSRRVVVESKPSIIEGTPNKDGTLVLATTALWQEIAGRLAMIGVRHSNMTPASGRIIAGAFHKLGFDEVILTPQRTDYGRDVIAVSNGFLSQKVIVSVKAYAPDNLSELRRYIGL